MRLAEQGDIFSPSSNFLRDTLFNGNQELYNAFRNDVSTATMIANLTLISVLSANTRMPKPQNLMDELASSGVKHNPDDIVFITRLPNGKIVWLETGSPSAGLQHIVGGKETNFLDRGITDIPALLYQVLQTVPIEVTTTVRGVSAIYLINGKKYLVAYGHNGFIVSFYPIH